MGKQFFIHDSWYTLKFETSDKMSPFIKVAIFCDTVLVSNYHSCKGETIELITYCMIYIICKTVKQSHLKKSKIIQNVKKPIVRSHLHIF